MKKPIISLSQLDLKKQYTYADYLTWQFSERVELIKGWIYKMTPAPRRKHQAVVSNLSYWIYDFIKDNECRIYTAPFDVRLIKNVGQTDKEIDTVVQPDISVICDRGKLDEKGCFGAPDLIIEILSPSTTKKDYNEKYLLYEENNVKEYWLANPDAKSIEVFVLNKGKYYSKGVYSEYGGFKEIPVYIFPKLKLNLTEIFKD